MREGLVVAGKYRLLKLVGSGGMGSVWLARNEMTDREFAIKFLHAAAAQNPKVLARFFQEAKVSGRLRHPAILEIFDVGTAHELEDAPFLVMELLDGVPLDVAIHQLKALPLRLTLQIAGALARALAVAHERGVVHRDLKPANVFLHRAPGGGVQPKLLDFGISKLSRPEPGVGDSAAVGLTQTGAILGSPLYMSPEQASGDKNVDGRCDIHALGVLMWWCLLGRSPFRSTSYNNLVVEIITGERPRLSETEAQVPPGVSEIVSRAFARKREDRFQSAPEVADAIDAELARLGPGPGLDSRELAEDLFARASAPREGGAGDPASTTGAVSVDAPLPGEVQPAVARSPAAYTVDPMSVGPALAPTQSLAQAAAAGGTAPVSRRASRGGRAAWLVGAALVAAAAVGGTAFGLRRFGGASVSTPASASPSVGRGDVGTPHSADSRAGTPDSPALQLAADPAAPTAAPSSSARPSASGATAAQNKTPPTAPKGPASATTIKKPPGPVPDDPSRGVGSDLLH